MVAHNPAFVSLKLCVCMCILIAAVLSLRTFYRSTWAAVWTCSAAEAVSHCFLAVSFSCTSLLCSCTKLKESGVCVGDTSSTLDGKNKSYHCNVLFLTMRVEISYSGVFYFHVHHRSCCSKTNIAHATMRAQQYCPCRRVALPTYTLPFEGYSLQSLHGLYTHRHTWNIFGVPWLPTRRSSRYLRCGQSC